ncbi:MAG TPA: metallophosphoesterase [Nocardioides sp.]|nr:metallophosphoesterase [Nocardioides sp.]
MSEAARQRVLARTALASRATAYVAVWAVLAAVAGLGLFLLSSRTVVLATHDAVLQPNLRGHVVVKTGPVLPDLRIDSGGRVGVDIRLEKTDAESTEALVERYAYLATQPEGQVAKVRAALVDMAVAAALRGAVVGLLPIVVWLLIGAARRRELASRARSPGGAVAALAVVLFGVLLWEPWAADENSVQSDLSWVPLADFVGAGVALPEETQGIEVRGDVTTAQTRRLVESAIDTYARSKTFYAEAAQDAAGLDLRQPDADETVVVLVSDRHDNVGMDAVTRAIADAGGATAAFDAGDDTSSGNRWEAFSLDSVSEAFEDLDRWGVAGNHDHGTFVRTYLDDRGWSMLDGEVVDGPAGTLLGVDDPRSSGLGSWRDETGLSFEEVGTRIADAACDAEDRVGTILVHDANLGQEALERGCADLVVGGHLHVQLGPTRVVGENGQAGYSYTNGTTGGAAFAFALGSKPRREAQVTLLTYRDGRPAGVQPVSLRTDGRFVVGEYVPLHLTEPSATAQK